jgi:hypothetical protein
MNKKAENFLSNIGVSTINTRIFKNNEKIEIRIASIDKTENSKLE